MSKVLSKAALDYIKSEYIEQQSAYKRRVLVCGGASCVSSSCQAVKNTVISGVEECGLGGEVAVTVTGCVGLCAVGPTMLILPDGIFYTEMTPEKAERVVSSHLIGNELVEEFTFYDNELGCYVPKFEDIRFFRDQFRIVLRNCGLMDFSSLEAYISRDGYYGLQKALEIGSDAVVSEVTASGLRGRGGAGFPTGIKWQAGKNAAGDQKYMVCNADEGDPGAFMDRSVLEGDPHSIIEGMLIGGFAIGASKGYVYVRAEYPLAIERLSAAIDQAREAGLLGENIFGSGFSFDVEIRMGAGAFVCGEETSLLASIEGRRGEPSQKPPFPFEEGLFHKPTIINNVESLANIAPIIFNGSAWFSAVGTEKSKGTKVFALAGDIVNTGIIEVPMGFVLGEIIYSIGGGIVGSKRFKAIQSGGPSGGCLTNEHLNTSVDYESLSALGAIMGSGGLIVMDEDTCMVDTARYFMDFIRDESCGKCAPCRIGTKRMLEILERITVGEGRQGDIELLIELAEALKESAMCGLGQTAANPILSTIRYFRDEFETHIQMHHCNAGVCSDLCDAPCTNACPASVNVPGYMALIGVNKFHEAYDLIRQDNPFPAVCGRVCTHPCESHCRRAQVDEALSICKLKRFVGDYALRDEYDIPVVAPLPPTGKRVAVIGSGPSGLACAYYLNQLGHKVEVFEGEAVAGGVMYWGIPEYRLPNGVLAKEIHAMERAGVVIRTNTMIGKDISFEVLQEQNDAVYIAIGTQKSKLMGIAGEELHGVESGLSFLRRIGLCKDMSVPTKMVVVGGGSTAMDVAMTALRLGTEKVTVIYRRTIGEMPASADDVRLALEEGIEILPLVSPVAILGENGKATGISVERMEEYDFSRDGRRRTRSMPCSDFVIECDGVIAAVNQEIDDKFTIISDEEGAALAINRFTSQTNTAGVFAGGDVSPWGEKTVINAIADGKRAAANIDSFLGGTGELYKGPTIEIPILDEEAVDEHMRFPAKTLSVDDRIDSFGEISCGFHKLDAVGESLRCLRCDRRS